MFILLLEVKYKGGGGHSVPKFGQLQTIDISFSIRSMSQEGHSSNKIK